MYYAWRNACELSRRPGDIRLIRIMLKMIAAEAASPHLGEHAGDESPRDASISIMQRCDAAETVSALLRREIHDSPLACLYSMRRGQF